MANSTPCARIPPPQGPRSARPSAASARPTRTRSAAAPSASWTSPISTTLDGKIERLLTHHNALRRGLGLEEIKPETHSRRAGGGRAAHPALYGPHLVAARGSAPRGQAHPVRGRAGRAARHRPRHLSLRHVVQYRGVQRRDRRRPRPEGRSAMCWASPRPIRRASAKGLSRPNCSTRPAATIGEKGREFGTVTGRARRCGWFDAVLVRQTVKTSGIDGIALTKLDILDGFESSRSASAISSTARPSITCRPARRRRRGSSRSTRPSRAGASRPAARAPGRNCRRRRSNMSAGSRN